MKIMSQNSLVSARPILSRKLLFYIFSASIVACPTLRATAEDSLELNPDTATTNQVVATIPVGTGPYGIVVSPDNAFVYVANSQANTVSKIDTSTNAVVATFSPGSSPAGLAVTPDGTQLYVGNMVPGTVTILDTSSGAILKTITVPDALGQQSGYILHSKITKAAKIRKATAAIC